MQFDKNTVPAYWRHGVKWEYEYKYNVAKLWDQFVYYWRFGKKRYFGTFHLDQRESFEYSLVRYWDKKIYEYLGIPLLLKQPFMLFDKAKAGKTITFRRYGGVALYAKRQLNKKHKR